MGSIQRGLGVGVATVLSLDVPFPRGDWPAVVLPGGGSFRASPSFGVNEKGEAGPDPSLGRREHAASEKDGAPPRDQLEKDGGPVYGEGDTRPGGSVCVCPSETHHQPRYGPVTSRRREGSSLEPGVHRHASSDRPLDTSSP